MAKKAKQDSASALEIGGVNLKEVERLLAFMQAHGLEEFEYQDGAVHIRLKKTSGYSAAVGAAPAYSVTQSQPAGVPVAPAVVPPPAPQQPQPSPAEDLHIVKSPIVGTYYASPSPDSEPFVTVGSRVEAGQVLCIVEAMKLMNEIECDVAGELARVFVENGHPVEYGEPLFGIKVNGGKK